MKRLILFTLLLASLLFGETIQRDRTALRSGPGAWYPLLAELNTGSSVKVVNTGEQWVEVSVSGESGFVASKAFTGKVQTNDVFAQMSAQTSSTKVSLSGVTAAVKGFADRFSKRLDAEGISIEQFMQPQINEQEYLRFKSKTATKKELKKLNRKFGLKKLSKNNEFTFTEEGTGLAIAAKLSTMGLMTDPGTTAYVNQVGTYVAEQSEGYDIAFRFFILDQDAVNGFACPGGIIFITRGALELMENEAELACFLGHEIAHVVHRHGMQEMEERKEMIMADNVFEEMAMENQVSTEIEQASMDLDEQALSSYENIFHGRLEAYEISADELGLRYAARSGYDPRAMTQFLQRLTTRHATPGSDHYSSSKNMDRIKRLESKYKADYQAQAKLLGTHRQRFDEQVNL